MKYLKFINLANKRFVGRDKGDWTNYLKFQEFQAEEIVKEIKKRKIKLFNLKVLELGAGKGGYSQIFKKNSKEFVTSDLEKSFILKSDPSLNFKKVDINKKFPFKDNEFDFVFSCSLIEHIKDPKKMFLESKRVLKFGGYLYLSFPPFYSPVGGHNVKPFHYFGEKFAIKLTNFFMNKNYTTYENFWGAFGIHIRTIKSVKKMLLENNFKIKNMWTRFSFLNFSKIPVLNEFLTWHVCFLCENIKRKF